ncbi:ABC transporter ATP-binding protein [uncultured Clostridium sp.]|uniref:ABC transporter ATP-binding protein n=1 Tax=uncultured Clostridium sp. TaxID=59620 RepID=UPI0025DFF0CE|nr:ABC transporter ATP-binding protein [uncultured Clostridium sp.]
MNILEVKNLVKKYGENTAVNGINFSIEKGDIYGVLGPNGAGKSTTMNLITGLLNCDGGSIKFENNSSIKEWSPNIGLVPQDLAIYNDLTAEENIEFFCSLYGFKGNELKKRVDSTLEFVGLTDVRKKKAGEFSGGMKRRLNIACAISHSPKLIIMDEPTVGIDPQSRNHILENVNQLREKGITIIYTSHYMEEVEEVCNKIIIIDHGKVVADGTKEEIKSKISNQKIFKLNFAKKIDCAEELKNTLQNIDGIINLKVTNSELSCSYKNTSEIINKIILSVTKFEIPIANIENETPDLESVFLSITGKELRD